MEKTNEFRIVGRLTNVDTKVGVDKNGKEYINVNVTVNSNIDNVINNYNIVFKSNKLTKDGKENKLYSTYANIDSLQGKKVSISGSLNEWRRWSNRQSQLTSIQQLVGKFINIVPETNADEGKFSFVGFVARELNEKRNKDNEVYMYELTLGQSNYNDTKMNMYTFQIQPEAREIIQGVEGYYAGSTVRINGILNFTSEDVVFTRQENAFGNSEQESRSVNRYNFFITGGSNPFDSESEDAYKDVDIKNFIKEYKENDLVLTNAAKNNDTSAQVSKASVAPTIGRVTSRQTSLI